MSEIKTLQERLAKRAEKKLKDELRMAVSFFHRYPNASIALKDIEDVAVSGQITLMSLLVLVATVLEKECLADRVEMECRDFLDEVARFKTQLDEIEDRI